MSSASGKPPREITCIRRHAPDGEIESLGFTENGYRTTKSSDEVVSDVENDAAQYVLRIGLRIASLRVERSSGKPLLVTALDGTPRRLHELPECD